MHEIMALITRAGGFVGSHMQIIVPICVVTGILIPQVFTPLKVTVPVLFAIITYQGSLNTTLHQVAETFQHPRTLIVVLLTTTIVVPVIAHAAASVVFTDPEVVTGVVVEYSIPIAVTSFMWIDLFHGNVPLGLASILISTLIAPVTIPITVQVLMGASVAVDAVSMMQDLLFMVAVPAALGVATNELTGGWGHERLSPRLSPVCRLLTVLVITCNATGLSSYVLSFDPVVLQAAVFILVFATLGFVLGIVIARVLGLPLPDLFTVCFCVGLRNISSGSVIVSQFFPGAAIIPVMLGTLFQQTLAATFGSVLHRLTASERARTHRRVLAARLLTRYRRNRDDA